jgi:hypothetical protein
VTAVSELLAPPDTVRCIVLAKRNESDAVSEDDASQRLF